MRPWTKYPTAVTGTWSDVERRAWYLYEYGYTLDEREMAEAVLALLRAEYERREKDA